MTKYTFILVVDDPHEVAQPPSVTAWEEDAAASLLDSFGFPEGMQVTAKLIEDFMVLRVHRMRVARHN